MKKINYKNGIVIGCISVLIGIIIGVTLESDIGFVFAGLGTMIIGFSTLTFINKKEKDDK